ncbi:MAG: hypothetical protein AAF580_13030 [Pseudomonadota bacterium]
MPTGETHPKWHWYGDFDVICGNSRGAEKAGPVLSPERAGERNGPIVPHKGMLGGDRRECSKAGGGKFASEKIVYEPAHARLCFHAKNEFYHLIVVQVVCEQSTNKSVEWFSFYSQLASVCGAKRQVNLGIR